MYSLEELEAEGITDFRVFLCHVWAHLLLPRPTKIQLNIARWLQKAPRRLILQAFRGVGKSYITVAFVLWTLLLDPQKKIMVVSASDDLAHDFTKLCFQLIEGMPVLQHLRPGRGQLRSTEKFDVGPALASKNPSVKSVGIRGQLTGSRADLIIPDDVETPKNSQTPTMREQIAELVKEFDALLLPGGRILYLGTPQVEESLYRKLEGRGYITRIWPSEIPEKPDVYGGRLAPYVQQRIAAGWAAHTPLEPTRFPADDLAERKLSYGEAGYALQFLLDTTPSDADKHPLKLRDLMVLDCDPKMGYAALAWGGSPELVINDLAPGGFDGDRYHRPAWKSPEMATYAQTVMAIDPSGRGKDETAYAILKYLHGNLYLMDIGGFVDGYGQTTLELLAGRSLRWGVTDIIIEQNFGNGMFDELFKPYLIRVFEEDSEKRTGKKQFGSAGRIDQEFDGWSSTQKETRILDTLEPLIRDHRLVVSRRVLEEDIKQQHENSKYSFVQQLTRMQRLRGALAHDDRIDALAMGCAYFTEKMKVDQKKATQQHKDTLLDMELQRFHEHVFGMAPVDTTWMSRRH